MARIQAHQRSPPAPPRVIPHNRTGCPVPHSTSAGAAQVLVCWWEPFTANSCPPASVHSTAQHSTARRAPVPCGAVPGADHEHQRRYVAVAGHRKAQLLQRQLRGGCGLALRRLAGPERCFNRLACRFETIANLTTLDPCVLWHTHHERRKIIPLKVHCELLGMSPF